MSDPIWQYANPENTVVNRTWPDGRTESSLTSAPDFQAWLAEGNTPNPYITPPAPIPQKVPMWAVRTVLQNDNLFEQAQALVNSSTDNGLRNVWEYGNYADRNSPAINQLGQALGLTEAQMDQMFIEASGMFV